ncbi:unnamed protein product, partial [Durusdinium trenchii]
SLRRPSPPVVPRRRPERPERPERVEPVEHRSTVRTSSVHLPPSWSRGPHRGTRETRAESRAESRAGAPERGRSPRAREARGPRSYGNDRSHATERHTGHTG